ncbi:MAG: nucleoside 2-deoxyribosyltransferase [Rhodospirillum sp.]|nr:nucleoside 2-deoxyribosyltransferase [Rhodospirillum sp.]MCF8489062.1 nucleoside 2-deoxyribosyltransferase [Rhodospirillum sp.]MCF8501235.1 nucleoside 2-deoxyribosyltransferase [Rhodospirillum sp.]
MRLYLAGPDVFEADPLSVAGRLKDACAARGFDGVFPLDSGLSLAEMGKSCQADAIYRANIDLIQSCDGLVANMAPFRGPSMDVGTAFEMGYASALDLPVIGYSDLGAGTYLDRVLIQYRGCLIQRDGRWWDSDGLEVEDFGLLDNLMMCCAADAITHGLDQALIAMRYVMTTRKERGGESSKGTWRGTVQD